MATSKIKFIVTDGNLFTEAADEDGVSALIFDVSTSPFDGSAIPTDGEVYRVFSLEQAVSLNPNDATKGVLPLVIDSNNTVTDAG